MFLWKLYCIAAFLVFSTADEIDQDWLYNGAATLHRHFHSRFGHQMCQVGLNLKENVVFSSFRVYTMLLTMYSAASDALKNELNINLGLYGVRRELVCQVQQHMTQLPPCVRDQHFGAKFSPMLYYQETLTPNKKLLNNACFQNVAAPLDFSDTEATVETLRDWHAQYYRSGDKQIPYSLPNHEDQVFFTSQLSFCLDKATPYVSDGTLRFTDIDGNTHEFNAMKKAGKFYVLRDHKMNVTLYRDDLAKGAYYSVIVIPENFVPGDHQAFLRLFGPHGLSEMLPRVSKLSEAVSMEIRLPEVMTDTRTDLKNLLNVSASSLLFQDGAFPTLMDVPTKLNHFRYSESIVLQGQDDNSPQTPSEYPLETISTPFLYIIVEKQYSRPLQTTIDLGFGRALP